MLATDDLAEPFKIVPHTLPASDQADSVLGKRKMADRENIDELIAVDSHDSMKRPHFSIETL